MRNFIRNWLGIEDTISREEVREMCKKEAEEFFSEKVLKRHLMLAVDKFLNWHPHFNKEQIVDMDDRIIEELIIELIVNTSEEAALEKLSEKVNNEKFIDNIVERIKCKQV